MWRTMGVRMSASKPTKRSVALAVVKENDRSKVLLVRRPEDDEEFPGMWGLPAASHGFDETCEDVVRPIGVQKLGVEVTIGDRMASGRQERGGYVLTMCLYNASLDGAVPVLPLAEIGTRGVTQYTGWRWGEQWELEDSARRGSLCSQLLLDVPSRS